MDVGIARERWVWFIRALVRIAAVCIAIGAVLGDRHGASAGTSGATNIDQAGLFTAADNRTINRTAAAAGLHFIVVTDSRSLGNGNSWMQSTLAAYAAPDVVILAIHVDVAQPTQSLVVVWSGRDIGLTSAQDQAEANTLITSNPSSPLADRIDAMIWRLKTKSDADLRDTVAAATPVGFYTKGDPALAPASSAGYIAGTVIVDLVVALGAASIVRRLVRRQPKAALDLPV